MTDTLQNYQLVNASSGRVEYYTPEFILNAARLCMGSIELDPASCQEANFIVKADRYFNQAQDGLKQEWKAQTVWLNWPFSKQNNKLWTEKLLHEYGVGNFVQACFICYACTSERWFRPLLQLPQCFLHGRTNYTTPDGHVKEGNTKGSVVTYLGNNAERFFNAFKSLGTVKVEWDWTP